MKRKKDSHTGSVEGLELNTNPHRLGVFSLKALNHPLWILPFVVVSKALKLPCDTLLSGKGRLNLQHLAARELSLRTADADEIRSPFSH